MLFDPEDIFPNLLKTGFDVTSPNTPEYNCIAWAAGEDYRCWWPSISPFAYWPPGIEREESLECFLKAFRTLGFEPCADHELEKGFEKVAIYVDVNGPQHMARQLESGQWTSKLGSGVDISHPSLFALEDGMYGKVVQIMRRPRMKIIVS